MTGPIETEVKIPIQEEAQAARQRIEAGGYRITTPRNLQVDQVFDFPDAALRESGRLLRLRLESAGAILTYKGPTISRAPHKSREELETSAGDGDTLERILTSIGLVRSFRYEKYRTTFRAGEDPGLIMLDETPIGVFLELEGPAYWIDRTAQELGHTPEAYVTASYAALYRDYIQKHGGPTDMVFK